MVKKSGKEVSHQPFVCSLLGSSWWGGKIMIIPIRFVARISFTLFSPFHNVRSENCGWCLDFFLPSSAGMMMFFYVCGKLVRKQRRRWGLMFSFRAQDKSHPRWWWRNFEQSKWDLAFNTPHVWTSHAELIGCSKGEQGRGFPGRLRLYVECKESNEKEMSWNIKRFSELKQLIPKNSRDLCENIRVIQRSSKFLNWLLPANAQSSLKLANYVCGFNDTFW